MTTWVGEGQSPVAVTHAMGHRDLKTTMSYYRFAPEQLRALAESPVSPQRREAAISGWFLCLIRTEWPTRWSVERGRWVKLTQRRDARVEKPDL